MSGWRWLAGHRSLLTTAISGSLIAALVTSVAIVSSGYPAQRLDLDDGSVWAANGAARVIGRVNTAVLALNTVVSTGGTEVQTIQRGSRVLLFDRSNSTVGIVDPATSKVLDSVPLPPLNPQLALAGDNVVIAAGATGQIWIVPFERLRTFDSRSRATLDIGAKAVISVTPQGMLVGYSAETKMVYRVDAAHSTTLAESLRVRWPAQKLQVSVTSVGERWVLFDAVSSTMITEKGTTDLSADVPSGSRAVLQQASVAGDAVLLSSSTTLVSVPLDGGTPRRLVEGMGGQSAAPLRLAGCIFAAWTSGTLWRKCGSAPGVRLPLNSMPTSADSLAFVSNGPRMVLNDPDGGGIWAAQQAGELIKNWSDLITVRRDRQELSQKIETAHPEVDQAQLPPVAADDSFGARPGRSSILPVMLNDFDANRDILAISAVTGFDESLGRLDIVNDRQQLQITLGASVRSAFSFEYTITDGRGGMASARVTVTVHADGSNSAPYQVRQSSAVVVLGGRVDLNVLGEWIDPDGDPFYLASATIAPPEKVSSKPEGTVIFTDAGISAGDRTVNLTVSDGTASGSGSLSVTVKPPGEVPIIADHYVKLAYSGEEITLNPLEHVRGASEMLRLASVQAKIGVTITTSLMVGTFRFSSEQLGAHLISYVVNDGDQTVNGIVRIDVVAVPDLNTKPITIAKNVFVHSLSTQTIDVSLTDRDPAGGVLMLTDIYNLASDSGVIAERIDQRSIRVHLTAPLSAGPVSFNYRVSNGLAEAEGVVNVVEIARPARLQPPLANDDTVRVRVGDAVDIPVLDNDVQPDGEPLQLAPQLSTTLGDGSGVLFTSGNVLRYLAPAKNGDFTAVYQISDPSGQTSQARVTILVREPVPATNNPPVPGVVTARVIAGTTVRVSIPLSGIDPDGDSVKLLGQAGSPTKGIVTAVGTDFFDYRAGEYSAGTDFFSYTVVDSLGTRGTGVVRVGISSKRQGALNPIAVSDQVSTRPGSTVSVQVLANDSDPDGGAISVVAVQPNSGETVAVIVGSLVKITPPNRPGTFGVVYTIQNQSGGESSAFITVQVSAEASRAIPIVHDTVLTLADILGRESIEVDVVRNVFFADGDVATLAVSVLPGFIRNAVVTAGKRVRVTVLQTSQIIPFAVANPEDPRITAYAFIWVPGLRDALPQLNRKAPPITVTSGSSATVDLNDYVLAVGGSSVRITDTSTVLATHSDGSNLVVNEHTLRFTPAERYFGPAAISFEVTDGTSATDPNGHKATLVLGITVVPRQNQPPVFSGGVIDFEPGMTKTLDLLKLTDYPHPAEMGQLVYSVLAPLPQGFTQTLNGQNLELRASENAMKATSTAITLGVRDSAAEGQPGQIRLNLVASSRPLAQPADDRVLVARGQTVTVDVLANDQATNPFPGKPLSVLAVRGLAGGAIPSGIIIVPSDDRQQLTVTAATSAQPVDLNLQYQLSDATGDPDRVVWGAITVSVQDRPDPVSVVRVLAFGDRTLSVRWNPGPANNSPISGFTLELISASGQSLAKTNCRTSVCELGTEGNGPQNGGRVSVTAQNAIGSSDAAEFGTLVWSDVIPPPVIGLTATPIDGGLNISWSAVTDPPGVSAVNSYRLTVAGAGRDVDTAVCAAGLCSSTVSGLSNGQTVAVSLSARNSALTSLATWNSVSSSGTPAGRPLPVVTPTVTVNDDTITMRWAGAFNPNGRPISGYRAIAFTGQAPSCARPKPAGAVGQDVAASTSASFTDLPNDSNYSLMVLAQNSMGCTESQVVLAQTGPGVVTAVSTSGPQQNGPTFDYRLTGASIGGPLNGDYTLFYRLQGDQVPATEYGPVSFGAFLDADGRQSGHQISVQVRACRNTAGAGSVCQQAWSAPFLLGTPVDPRIGPVTFTPTANPSGPEDHSGTFSWPSWTTEKYSNIQYSCGEGVADVLQPAQTGQVGSCWAFVAPGKEPVLGIFVSANGLDGYRIQYDRNGNVQ